MSWIENGTLEIYIPEQCSQSRIVSIKISDLVYAESQGARIVIVRFRSNEFWATFEQLKTQGTCISDAYTLPISKWHLINGDCAFDTVYHNMPLKTALTNRSIDAESNLDDKSGGQNE